MRAHVAIAIATYRRPQGLGRLLASLDRLEFVATAAPEITIVVVDNDAATPLLGDAAGAATWSRHPISYLVEPQRGLAAVRNACLDHAPAGADFIAFIDDDEWAEPQWLEALLVMQRLTGADIVQGPVRPAFAAAPTKWLAAGHFHSVGPFVDGEMLTHGATGNVLLARAALARTGARFHAGFDRSGGEDVDFFAQLLAAGCRIVAAAEAIAHESIPPERMTLAWVLRRQFRTGHTLGAISRRQGGRVVRLAKAAGRIGFGAGQALIGAPLSPELAAKGLGNIAWGAGTLAAFAGIEVDHYGRR